MYIGLKETEQDFPTPPWLRAHCEANGGGWAIALQIVAGHPFLSAPLGLCFRCREPVEEDDWIIPMPWGGGLQPPFDKAQWICEHRECFVAGIITDKAQLAECRPPAYESLDPLKQWKINQRLGLLGWDPKAETSLGGLLGKKLVGFTPVKKEP